ncbi:MAG: hypothetical protein KDK08_28055 [Rhizobiaceae bacterium]|nr:hypothetical protein [Rhizobiaceae bacterium]
MANERVTKILLKEGLDKDTIAQMTDGEAWNRVYELNPPKRRLLKAPTICFTGFVKAEEVHYRSLADKIGLKPTGSVSGITNYLCLGSNPGPSKMDKARKAGVKMLSLDDFLEMVQTGELP